MKTINETFTDEEFEELIKRKNKFEKSLEQKVSWHDFIIEAIKNFI